MTAKTKALAPFEVKGTDDDARTFEGLASTWEQDLGGDIIHQGAFRRTLDHIQSSKRKLPLIDQHNYGSVRSVVGGMVEAKETDEGLEATFALIDGPDGEEIYRRVKGGFVDGLSIGYEPVRWEMEERDGEQIRHLHEVKLHEISVVLWPMNEGARIESVKSLLARFDRDEITEDELAELTKMEREIGALLAKHTPGLAPEDPRRLELEALTRDLTLRSLATRG